MIFLSCVPASTTCCSSGCSRTQKHILPWPTVLQASRRERWGWGEGGQGQQAVVGKAAMQIQAVLLLPNEIARSAPLRSAALT